MISYKFSSKYGKIRVVYFGAILVLIAVPRVGMKFLLSGKIYFLAFLLYH